MVNCLKNNEFLFLIQALELGSPYFALWYLYAIFWGNIVHVHKFPHWFSYVEDNLVLVLSSTDFSSLLSLVNLIVVTFNSLLKLKISALDAFISQHIDRFSNIVFKKSLSISFLPHIHSKYRPLQKMPAFYAYVYPALHICSNPSDISSELNYLWSLLLFLESKIPLSLIKPWTNLRSQKIVCLFGSCLNSVTLPLCSSVSFKISKILSLLNLL